MSWSLQIRNGDFALSGARLGTVTGAQKLVQDLAHWILEPMGTDDLHRGYGSLIDGGVTPTGVERESLIGSTDYGRTKAAVESEINRITREYQQQQLERIKRDRYIYNQGTLTAAEVLYQLAEIGFATDQDRLAVTLHIETGEGAGVGLNIAFDN